MVVHCCVCEKIRQDNLWVKKDNLDMGTVSHGYCPDCAKKAREEIDRERQNKLWPHR